MAQDEADDRGSLLPQISDENAKEEAEKARRRIQNERDMKGMKHELDVYKTNLEGEDKDDRWKNEFQPFKDTALNRARNLVENTARELYMDGRACANVQEETILAQPKLTAVVSAMTPKPVQWARQWYDAIQVTAQKVDDVASRLSRSCRRRRKAGPRCTGDRAHYYDVTHRQRRQWHD